MLILFYDTMWGQPLDTSQATADAEITLDRARFDEADAVVFHIPQWREERIVAHSPWRWQLQPEKREGQLWVAWSNECDEHYRLLRDGRFMRFFDITMTYHLDADIPLTYLIPPEGKTALIEALRRPPRPKQQRSPLASFVSSGFDASGREPYLLELSHHIAIDSYGKFMRNRTLVPDLGRSSKLEAIGDYKFAIAFENARGKDYVSEKFFDALIAGSIPVYLGAPNIEDFAPGDHCFINAADFPDPRHLADYLLKLADDVVSYQRYFAWKQQPFRASFNKLLQVEATSALKRLCDLVRQRRTWRSVRD
jgi:Glycosyltransferase family 10 (fucosyltransferase) C-term/Fucosyltransferase, N-terminal